MLLPRLLSAQGRRGVSGRGLPSTGEQVLQSPTKDMEMFGMEGRDADDDHNWWYSVLKIFIVKFMDDEIISLTWTLSGSSQEEGA